MNATYKNDPSVSHSYGSVASRGLGTSLRANVLWDAPHPIAIRMKGSQGPSEAHLQTRSSRGAQLRRRNTSQTSATGVQGLDERA